MCESFKNFRFCVIKSHETLPQIAVKDQSFSLEFKRNKFVPNCNVLLKKNFTVIYYSQ